MNLTKISVVYAILLVILFSTSTPVQMTRNDYSDYSGFSVLKVTRGSEGQVDHIVKENNFDVWSVNASHLDVLVPGASVFKFKKYLKRNEIPYSTLIRDLQSAIETENPRIGHKSSQPEKTRRMSWNYYHRLSVIYGYLDRLARTYRTFVTVGVLGTSVEKRPLKYIKISSGKPNATAIFIDGGIHAREWVSPATATYIIRELVEHRNALPKRLVELDFYILPVLNPDGYEYSHTRDRMWRKNRSVESRCAGTDLNRNFDFAFGGEGTSDNPCMDDYKGKSAASEPETQAVQNFLRGIKRNLKAYITFHSYGQYILIPYGYKKGKPAPGFSRMKVVGDAAARAIKRIAGTQYTVGNSADTLYPAAGGSDDWVKGRLGVPYTYCIELRDQGQHGFILPAKYIIPTAWEAFRAVKVISTAASVA